MSVSAGHENNRRMLRARDAMDRSYADALDIEALAASVHLSRAHFIRSFRLTFGETPHRYLQRRRLERAMTLLRETDRPVTGICLDVGFSSLGTFSRTFREIVGIAPSGLPRARADGAEGGDTRGGAGMHGGDLGSAIEHFRRRPTARAGLAWPPCSTHSHIHTSTCSTRTRHWTSTSGSSASR